MPPAGIRILTGGLSVAAADGRYVRRFVSVAGVPTLAGNTRSQVNAAAVTEVVLENPNGPVQSLLPANAFAAAFLENGDGARFGNRVKVARIGVSPVVAGIRAEGTYAAPTPPLTGVDILLLQARPVTDTGGAGTSTVVSSIAFRSRENLGAAAHGSLIRFSAGRVGAAVQDTLFDMQSGGAGIAELVSAVGTARLVPGGTAYVIRDSANTFDAHAFNAAGTSVTLAQSATTADVTIGTGTGTGNSNLNIRGAAGLNRHVNMFSGTSLRMQMGLNNAAESGGNAGSNFRIAMFTDAGAVIDEPVTIARVANGGIVLGGAGNRLVTIAGNAWGAGNASLRLNGLTSGAGAGAGTLTNAPAAGNPAFWCPVNIAGTVRFFPCW